MNDIERYLFDLNGYLLVKEALHPTERERYLAAVEQLQDYIVEHIDDQPQLVGFAGIRHRFDEKYQCFSYKSSSGGGPQYVVDDFLNASEDFDSLVGHGRTMEFVSEMITGPAWIGSSELRLRYRSNLTDTHMGGPMDIRNRFQFVGKTMYDSAAMKNRPRDFDLAAVRVLYALEDVPVEHGPLCVVPGSHKSNFFSPFAAERPTEEPGMVPVPMEAGDALFFTENLRHGGFPNLLAKPRRTLHLLFCPPWAGSQSPIHWNDRVYVSRQAWERYDDVQRGLVPSPADQWEIDLKLLRAENERMRLEAAPIKAELDRLQAELGRLQAEEQARILATPAATARGVLPSIRRLLGLS